MKRIVIVDVGSNTAKLIALAYEPGRSWRQLDELRAVVRLSEGLEEGGELGAKPFARGLAALRTFASYAKAAEVDDLVATTTSAVRDAANGPAFVAAAADLGVELRVLSGEDEARIGALAVANGLGVHDAVTFDLGGGSFQLGELRGRRWRRGESWPLGAVRATERYLRGDPPKGKGLKALATAAREAVAPWFAASGATTTFVGVGGTLRNLANVHQKRVGYPLDLLHGYRLPATDLQAIARDLAAMTTAERAAVPGLNRDRADIVAAGATVIAQVVAAAGVPEVLVSGQGLREGLFYPYLLPDAPDHLLEDVRSFSVLNLMRQYHDDPAHNGHVRTLALALFDALRASMGSGTRSATCSVMRRGSTTSAWRSTTTATNTTGSPSRSVGRCRASTTASRSCWRCSCATTARGRRRPTGSTRCWRPATWSGCGCSPACCGSRSTSSAGRPNG